MKDIETTLAQREATHGKYEMNASYTMQIFDILDKTTMPDTVRLAVFMIVHKLSRICCGNYKEIDHWRDICGYATLAMEASHDE